MAYKAKRKRHICSVRGCRNRDVILATKNGEFGGGIYLCRECIEALQEFIPMFGTEKNTDAETKSEIDSGISDTAENALEAGEEEESEGVFCNADKPVRKAGKAKKAGKQ